MAEPYTPFTSRVIPLPNENVDTDQIIPARYLKTTEKTGLADGLFRDWRYREDGTPNPDFVLNRPEMQGRQILLAGDNFGSGSSREHAPWALTAWGIRAVISTSFGDIFHNNALKNGLLPIEVDRELHGRLFELVAADPDAELTVDLEAQEVRLPGDEAIRVRGRSVRPQDAPCRHGRNRLRDRPAPRHRELGGRAPAPREHARLTGIR